MCRGCINLINYFYNGVKMKDHRQLQLTKKRRQMLWSQANRYYVEKLYRENAGNRRGKTKIVDGLIVQAKFNQQ
jgi:hypothetical protein